MKTLPVFLACLTLFIVVDVNSQNYYYYHGSQIPIQKVDDKILISSSREKWFDNSRVGLISTYKQNERNFNKNYCCPMKNKAKYIINLISSS